MGSAVVVVRSIFHAPCGGGGRSRRVCWRRPMGIFGQVQDIVGGGVREWWCGGELSVFAVECEGRKVRCRQSGICS